MIGLGWSALQTIVAVAVPVIGGIITVAVWFHRRINRLEEEREQKSGAGKLFNDSDDPLAIGLAREVRDINRNQKDTTETINDLRKQLEELNDRIDEITDRLEELEEED